MIQPGPANPKDSTWRQKMSKVSCGATVWSNEDSFCWDGAKVLLMLLLTAWKSNSLRPCCCQKSHSVTLWPFKFLSCRLDMQLRSFSMNDLRKGTCVGRRAQVWERAWCDCMPLTDIRCTSVTKLEKQSVNATSPRKPGAESQGHPVQTCWVWHISRKWCVKSVSGETTVWRMIKDGRIAAIAAIAGSEFEVKSPSHLPTIKYHLLSTCKHHLDRKVRCSGHGSIMCGPRVFRNLACHHVICTAPLEAKSNGSAMVQQDWTFVCLQLLTGAHKCSTWVLIFCVSGMPWVVMIGAFNQSKCIKVPNTCKYLQNFSNSIKHLVLCEW